MSNFYQAMHGINPATFFLLPLLGVHPDQIQRFRDCFHGDMLMEKTAGLIVVYTRTGGYYRTAEGYEEGIQFLKGIGGYKFDFDQPSDTTYAFWCYEIPALFADDVAKVMEGRYSETSEEYKQKVLGIYPKLRDKLSPLFYPKLEAVKSE